MPKCPCCHSEIQNFRGILFHDLDRAVYVDNIRYPLTPFEYRTLKAIYDYGKPMPPWMLEAQLYGSCDGRKQDSIETFVCNIRAKLGAARLQIAHRTSGAGAVKDEGYRILEFPK